MLLFRLQDRALRATLERLRHVASQTTGVVRHNVQRYLLKVQAVAQKLTPHEEGLLKDSAQTDVDFSGTTGLRGTITFGGLAQAYAEVQHENEEFTHTLAAYAEKHGLSTASQLRRNRKTGLMTLGQERVVGRRKAWRKVRGHEGGQAHFLHGKPSSAWDSTGHAQAKLEKLLDDNLHQLFEAAVSKGGAD